MDDAVFGSTDNFILAVRGGRVFKCDPTTGSVISFSDYQELANGGACIVYDPLSNFYYASAWNTGKVDPSVPGSVRNFYRLTANALQTPPSVAQIWPFGATFGIDAFALTATPACGICAMKNVLGQIYSIGWSSRNQEAYFLQFSAAAPGTNFNSPVGDYSYPSIAFAVVGGNRTSFCTGPGGNQVISWDWTASAGNTSAPDNSKGYVAIEYSDNHLYVTREFQFIDVYDTGLNFLGTINSGHSNFQGVNILRNPNDGLVYVAGGLDGTVLVINPAGGVPQTQGSYPPTAGHWAFSPQTFDLPWKFCFAGSKKFVVQQGAVGLNPIT